MRDFADFSNDFSDEERIRLACADDPRLDQVTAEKYLNVLEQRFDQKSGLINRGISNSMAEKFLDRQGWPRPPGWNSVFCYPGSNRMRTRYIVIVVVTVAIVVWKAFSSG